MAILWEQARLTDGEAIWWQQSLLANQTHSGVLSTLHSLYFPTWATRNRHFCFIPPSTHFLRVNNCLEQSSPIALKGPYRNHAAMPQSCNSDNLKEQFVAQWDTEKMLQQEVEFSLFKKKSTTFLSCVFLKAECWLFMPVDSSHYSSISATEEGL